MQKSHQNSSIWLRRRDLNARINEPCATLDRTKVHLRDFGDGQTGSGKYMQARGRRRKLLVLSKITF